MFLAEAMIHLHICLETTREPNESRKLCLQICYLGVGWGGIYAS